MRKKKKNNQVPSKPQKHVYSDSEVFYTEGFALDKYELADTIRKKERKEKRVAKGDVYSRIMKLIEERNIMDFYRLSNLIREDFPELEEGFYDRSSTFKAHIDSRRYAKACGFGELDYHQVCKTLEDTRKTMERLEKELSDAQRIANTRSDTLRADLLKTKKLYQVEKDSHQLCEIDLKVSRDRISDLESEVEYLKKKLKEAQELLTFEKLL